jgi:hypothetical protein
MSCEPRPPETRWPFGLRVKLADGWATVVSHAHPHRVGVYLWRSGEPCITPELVRDGEPPYQEVALPAPEPMPKYLTVRTSV